MTWPTWAKLNEKGLAQYALKEVANRLRVEPGPGEALARPDGYSVVAEAIYRALAGRKVRYSAPLYNPDLAVQEIRDPDTILDGSGVGTCLDLALLYAGAALGNDLLPLVVLLKGHALVAVATARGRRKATESIRKTEEGAWVADGVLRDAATLRKLVGRGDYVLVECTGFSAGEGMPETVPEGQGRVQGLLPFDRAKAAGREQLDRPDRAFLFAVDVAVLQDVGKLTPHEPPGRSLAAVPDLRRRLSGVLESHRVFGGRQKELGWIDVTVAGTAGGYLLVTGPSGCGKSALLANWVRGHSERGEAVAYHFVNRQHQLAGHDDTLRTLVQQLRYWRGQPGPAGGTGAELEAAYLGLLEVASPPPLVVVLDGLDEADGWTVGPQLFPRELPAGLHVVLSAREIAGRDWVKELALPAPPVLELGPLRAAGILDVLRSAGAPDWVQAPGAIAILRKKSGGDAFYLRHLIADLLPDPSGRPARIRTSGDLAQQPSGLDDYLEDWWKEIQGAVKGDQAVKQLLGYLLVARGRLTRDELLGLGPDGVLDWATVDPALELVRRFVVGDAERGYALSHWRFQDFLDGKKIPRASQAPYRERLVAWCAAWRENGSGYALRFHPTHLREAIDAAADPLPIMERLVATVSDPEYQAQRVEKTKDEPSLRADVGEAVAILARANDPRALMGLVRCALELDRVERRWLNPDAVFRLARDGAGGEAERRLSLFQGEEYWREAALLLIAWLLAPSEPDDARAIVGRFAADWQGRPPLPLLRDRVLATLGDGPAPELTLPYHPGKLLPARPEEEIQFILARAGGTLDPEQRISGIEGYREKGQYGVETPTYVAEGDSPLLVAFANDQPHKGLDYLRSYIAIHAGNPYLDYRNRSLWGILGAVLCMPDDGNVRDLTALLAAGAFAPSPIRFREALWIAIEARRALAGAADARPALEQALRQAEAEANQLKDERWKADSWGHHCRRLAAFAEALSRNGESARAAELLGRAADLPLGFAGYQAPASLTLADANLIVRPGEPRPRNDALDQARRAAHNVQDPGFCARTTARFNALRDRWWSGTIPDLPRVVAEFTADPEAARFAPVHRIEEPFADRWAVDEKLPLDWVRAAATLAVLATTVYDLPVSALVSRNPRFGPNDALAPGTEVTIPDPKFVPLLAAHLSAEVLAQSGLSPDMRVNLIRQLVPVALANPTALGTVLARLILALDPPPLDVLDQLLPLAPPALADHMPWNVQTTEVWAT
jgi:hypothetical protein